MSFPNTRQAAADVKLYERVLLALGFKSRPACDVSGLTELYSAWCQKIPFDNIHKLIHLHSKSSAALPGDDSVRFFEDWLAYGTGGTCWAGSNGLYSLLSLLGFDVHRAVGTMLIARDVPPNHGTLIVNLGNKRYLVDTSIMHGVPLRIDGIEPESIEHLCWGVKGWHHNNQKYLWWRPLHMLKGCDCQIYETEVEHRRFVELNEKTRKESPFNFSLYLRINRLNSVVGIADGQKIVIDHRGMIRRSVLTVVDRNKFLHRELGINKDILQQLLTDNEPC